jgi:hypothetical protein
MPRRRTGYRANGSSVILVESSSDDEPIRVSSSSIQKHKPGSRRRVVEDSSSSESSDDDVIRVPIRAQKKKKQQKPLPPPPEDTDSEDDVPIRLGAKEIPPDDDHSDDEVIRIPVVPVHNKQTDTSSTVETTTVHSYRQWIRTVPKNGLCNAIGLMSFNRALIEELRTDAYQRCERFVDPNFDTVSLDQMSKVFGVIDSVYFDGILAETIQFPMRFEKLKAHARKAGHMRTHHGNLYFIGIAEHVFNSIPVGETRISNGIPCSTRLACLLNVFCHEVIHLLNRILCPVQRSQMHGRLFKALVLNLFGQLSTTHELDRPYNGKPRLTKEDVKKGDCVMYTAGGRVYKMHVTRLNRTRATLVSDTGETSRVYYGSLERCT